MKILFVTYDFPYPTNSGGKNRAYNLLKHTAGKSEIYLFSFVRDDYNPEHNEEILNLGVKEIKVFRRKKLKALSNIPKTIFNNSSIFKTLYFDKEVELTLTEIIKRKKIDVIHFESSYTGYYIGQGLKKLGVKQVLGTENIEFILYQDYAKFSKKFYLKPFINFQAGKLKGEELSMVKMSDHTTTITKSEADILEELTGKACSIVANGIDPKEYAYRFDKKIKNNILFVGNFSYFPNVDGIEFFLNEVFPHLKEQIKLTVIGKNSNKVLPDNDTRILKKEFVEDIIAEYRASDVMVFPIRIGGGTNFKVLEAMALGIPIVAHPARLSGLNAIENIHFLPATTGVEYAEKIEKLYTDVSLRERITKEARELIDKHYAWSNIGEELLKVWRS